MHFISFCFSVILPTAVDPNTLPYGVDFFDANDDNQGHLSKIKDELQRVKDQLDANSLVEGYNEPLAIAVELFLNRLHAGKQFKCSDVRIRFNSG